MWSRVLQAACVAVKSPISSYFIHLLVSESASVPPAWMCWPVGTFFCCECTFSYVWMHDFFPLHWCVTFCLQLFCSYNYRQCFQPPLSLPSPPKHQFPFPASSSRLTQPKPLAFLSFAFFKNGFSFLWLSFFFYYNNYYYCKVYVEETFVYNTITILS